MGKNKRKAKTAKAAEPCEPLPSRANFSKLLAAGLLAIAGVAGTVAWRIYSSQPASVNVAKPTFSHDVAPLIWRRCATCHHVGGVGPFALLSYADIAKRAEQIVKVTQSRYMPPWLPARGYGEFDGDRSLSDDEILMLKNWVAQGMAEGGAAPAAPQFNDDWNLGKPDMVVQPERVFTLPAEGRDVYRNFAVRVPIPEDKFVKGIEFHPGSSRIHHAFIYVDPTPASRKREAKETDPGWPGMGTLPASAESPSGQFIHWQPGKIARMHEDTAWKLAKGTDLVLQLHMQPGGKPEIIQPSVALYFTDKPGTIHPTIALLRAVDMDIPAGEKAYTVQSAYTVPVDVNILALLPHVHYLGKDLRAFATLPSGAREWLLWIKDWDFNWQGEYTFKRPVLLPKGSRIEMAYTFDNSAENSRNPNRPPQRVRYGLQSTNEMAELWLLMLPRNDADTQVLKQDRAKANMTDAIAKNKAVLRTTPNDAHAHLQLGKIYLAQGQPEAESHLRSAVRLDESNSDTHYYLAYLLQDRIQDRRVLMECLNEYKKAVQFDRENYQALNGLGLTLLQAGAAREAEAALREAVRLHPNDPVLEGNLELARKALGR